jgi:hypothetical protein
VARGLECIPERVWPYKWRQDGWSVRLLLYGLVEDHHRAGLCRMSIVDDHSGAWVQPTQLAASLVDGAVPLDGWSIQVALPLPGCDLTTGCIDIAESSRKALAGEHGELAFRHVESASEDASARRQSIGRSSPTRGFA